MMELLAPVAGGFWLGVLTAISPCPLATNIAAVSFVAHRLERRRWVLWVGAWYTLGRSATYLAFSALIVGALVNVPVLADALQRWLPPLLGPVLILVGMVLLGLLAVPLPTMAPTDRACDRLGQWGVGGAFLLGAFFALAFCPVSAAVFFGSLLPLSAQAQSPVAVPVAYGIGTGAPVFGFAVLVAGGSAMIGQWHRRVARFGDRSRQVTGVILILAGIFLTVRHVIGLR